jgi:hypothetical protein
MPRRLYRVYVDETGDRGMTSSASPFFIVSAVMVRDDRDADLRALRDQICIDLGKPAGTVLHWAVNMKDHGQRKHVAGLLGAADFMRVAYVIVHKAQLQQQSTALRDPTLMYNYAVRRLLERVTWCVDERDGEAILTFAHIKRFPYAKLTHYLQTLRAMGSNTQIRWGAIHGTPRIDISRAVSTCCSWRTSQRVAWERQWCLTGSATSSRRTWPPSCLASTPARPGPSRRTA